MTELGDTARAASDLTSTARDRDYGDPRINYSKAARIASAITGKEWTMYDVMWALVAVKIARERQRHKPDNLIDLAGYADLLNYALERGGADTLQIQRAPMNLQLSGKGGECATVGG